MTLTVAIPTYNRNQTLLDNLQHLLPQLTPECRLLIIDNCSDVPVAETLGTLLATFPHVTHEFVRNRTNIGANANILRCFELCDTEWIWVLSDDDTVKANAISTISAHIAAHPECLLLNFSCDGLRKQAALTNGLEELVDKLDGSANLPWISSSVYKARVLITHLKFGYQYGYSMLPHVVMLLVSIGEAGICYFSPDGIIADEAQPPPPEERWSRVNLALGYPVLLDLPLTARVREGLAKKLLVTNTGGKSIKLSELVYQLLLLALKQHDRRSILYLYDQACVRGFYFDSRVQRTAKTLFGRLLLRFPTLTALAYRIIKGRPLGGQRPQDRYARI